MTKKYITLALALLCAGAFTSNTYAKTSNETERLGFTFEVGADVVSSYIWRGYNLGGLSIQPSVSLGWGGLYLSGWANIGADNWKFQELAPELDITIGYDNYGLKADLTHLYYFEGEDYFPKGGFKPNCDPDSVSSSIEAHIGFHLGDLIESVPLCIDWYTIVYGGDCYINELGNWQRAWSTYIELGYTFELPLDIMLNTTIGVTPWKGYYSNYEEVWTNAKTVAINNINLKLERYFDLRSIELGVWAQCMLNCYGIDKTNVIKKIGDNSDQRFNWNIGASLYIGNN